MKWADGKEQELNIFFPIYHKKNLRITMNNFVGGGAVYTAIQADKYFINDKSDELILLYRCLTNEDEMCFKQQKKLYIIEVY